MTGGVTTDPSADISHLSRQEQEAVRKMWAELEQRRLQDFVQTVMAMSPQELMAGLSTSPATRRLQL